MTIETTKQQYADLRAKALAICDAAVKDDRPLTKAEQTQLASTVAHAKSLHADIEKQRSVGMSPEELDRIMGLALTDGRRGSVGGSFRLFWL